MKTLTWNPKDYSPQELAKIHFDYNLPQQDYSCRTGINDNYYLEYNITYSNLMDGQLQNWDLVDYARANLFLQRIVQEANNFNLPLKEFVAALASGEISCRGLNETNGYHKFIHYWEGIIR